MAWNKFFIETIKQADTGCWTHVFRYDIFRVLKKTHKCLVRLMISHTPPDKVQSLTIYIFRCGDHAHEIHERNPGIWFIDTQWYFPTQRADKKASCFASKLVAMQNKLMTTTGEQPPSANQNREWNKPFASYNNIDGFHFAVFMNYYDGKTNIW